MRSWLGDAFAYEPQSEGDLGERMAAAISARLEEGAARVVLIGTDCPTVSAATVRAAFDALDSGDVVFGPAADGGYYLIGMRRLHDSLFLGIPWSSERTLRESLERVRAAGLRVALLDVMRDIDTAEDWRAYGGAGAGWPDS